ncbi:hypothetical protein [Puniceibacterium antarcticum]|uniref:hypothetical protein n=1 Tax=Puniceibacterium antarcticum TaxID=1206336 RepID=UPI00117BD569|nr:hypothetical protein [Puniceibacterium antarcticum]
MTAAGSAAKLLPVIFAALFGTLLFGFIWPLFSSCIKATPLDPVWSSVDLTTKLDDSVLLIPLIVICMATVAGGCAFATWYRRKPHKLTYLSLTSAALLLVLFEAQQWYIAPNFNFTENVMSSYYFFFLGRYLRLVLVGLVFIGISSLTFMFHPSRLVQGMVMGTTMLLLAVLFFGWVVVVYGTYHCYDGNL